MLELGLGIGLFRKRGPSVSEILAALGGADFTPLADYSNCWSDSLGTTQATRDSVVGKIASTVGSFVATQSTEGYKPILRDGFSYKPMVSSTTGETWTFTGTPIANRAGLQRQTDGTLALRCGGITNNANTTDSAATSQTGDQTYVFTLSLTDWTPATTDYFCGKYGADGNRAFAFSIAQTGKIYVELIPTGGLVASAKTYLSTSIVPIADGNKITLKISCDLSNGSNSVVTFSTCADWNASTRYGTWVQLGNAVTSGIITAIHDSTEKLTIGGYSPTSGRMSGLIHYAAAWANDTGTGTPAWEFYPDRDGAVPSCPYLDFDGTDDWLETNIAPGSYDAGYLCGGWVQMEAVGSINAVFGSSASAAVHGVRLANSATNTLVATRFNGTVGTSSVTTGTSSAYSPCVLAAEFTPSNSKARINSLAQATDVSSSDYRGSTQVALIGATNNTESGVSATNFMQGCMFSQIWLPSIPTDEQQAVLRAYCASKAGVTL